MAKKIEPDFSGEAGPALHSARWRFGPFELDETSRELRRGGVVVTIEAKPLNMLMLFLRNPGELVTKDELLDKLWTGRIVGEAVIGNCVTRLRQVLGEEAAGWLRSIHGFGYRFDGPVQLVEDERAYTSAPPKLAFQAGDQLPNRPNWQLVRRLGSSGDSWLAEHAKTHARRVFKFTAEPRGLSALKREVTVYRLLRESVADKVCYVDLLDWNFDAPPWFIEAEYCPGGSLQEWFEVQGGIARVPLATRLELIAKIAEALAKVHAVGVLHKDLKPANVLVVIDADPQPSIRLTDFGASRLLDPARLASLEITRLGFTQVIDNTQGDNDGTPLYLAPEIRAGHPATVKADIYALGVMLYQFIIGNLRRELASGWENDIDDTLMREDIAAATHGNLELRLGDAADLARRLRARDARRAEIEQARLRAEESERTVRAGERARARRVGLWLAFGSLAIGFATSTKLFIDARAARAHAEAESARAGDAAKRAERETDRAEAVSKFLTRDLFAPVTSGTQSVKNMTVAELLKTGASSVGRRFADDPGTAADLYAALGISFEALEMTPEAEDLLERAMAGHAESRGAVDISVVNDAAELAMIKFTSGRDSTYLADYDALAVAAAERLGPLSDAVVRLRCQLAWSRLHRGQLLLATAAFKSILADQLRLHPDDDRAIADSSNGLSLGLAVRGDYLAAEPIAQSAIERAIRAFSPKHELVSVLHSRLGGIANETGRYALAEQHYQVALRIAEAWGKDGNGPRITALVGLARTRIYQRRYDEAIAISRRAMSGLADHPGLLDQSAVVRLGIGEALIGKGELGVARRELDDALRVGRKSYGDDHIVTRRVRLALARLVLDAGDVAAARELVTQPQPLHFDDLADTHRQVRQWQEFQQHLDADGPLIAGTVSARMEAKK